jgi:hypothetical protein
MFKAHIAEMPGIRPPVAGVAPMVFPRRLSGFFSEDSSLHSTIRREERKTRGDKSHAALKLNCRKNPLVIQKTFFHAEILQFADETWDSSDRCYYNIKIEIQSQMTGFIIHEFAVRREFHKAPNKGPLTVRWISGKECFQ